MKNSQYSLSASVDFEVPFHDVDSMEIAWHGNYIKYFEYARTKFLQMIQYDYVEMRESGYGWPIVDVGVKYIKPLRYGQKAKVVAYLDEYENRLKFKYDVIDLEKGELLTRGHTIQLAIDMRTGDTLFVSPEILTKKIEKLL
jgi:acyl-CoA thioester hydrolase